MSKKEFNINPVMEYISTEPQSTPSTPAEPPRYTEAPVEVKSKRVNLVIQPSLYRASKEYADQHGISLNELIHQALREFITKE